MTTTPTTTPTPTPTGTPTTDSDEDADEDEEASEDPRAGAAGSIGSVVTPGLTALGTRWSAPTCPAGTPTSRST